MVVLPPAKVMAQDLVVLVLPRVVVVMVVVPKAVVMVVFLHHPERHRDRIGMLIHCLRILPLRKMVVVVVVVPPTLPAD